MTDAWLAFLGGVLATLVGGLVASVVQRHNETVKRKAEASLDVYFRLLELNQQYFWIASSEMHGEKARSEVVAQCRELSWKLADKLRACDTVKHLDEILDILFNSSIASASDRANRLNKLIEDYGNLVNPTYARSIKRISEGNIRLLGSGAKIRNPAPTTWSVGE